MKILFKRICYFLAFFSPFYLKFLLGESYHSGFIVGALCSWGAYSVFNKIPNKSDENDNGTDKEYFNQ